MFEPIAIVGRSCVLPGALNPEELWNLVINGKDQVSAPPDDYWKIDPTSLEKLKNSPTPEMSVSDKGGYVQGFRNIFNPDSYEIPKQKILELDPLFQWLLHCANEALIDSDNKVTNNNQIDLIVGNLSYSTQKFNEYARSVWLENTGNKQDKIAPENRFMSGYPAHFVANALGLGGDAFCLDAACASSLYAIKIACDRLQDRTADLVLAGGVNHADDLVLHMGFTSLQALSPTGQSRPFHRDADGLLPAEGAAIVALKRLEDAIADGTKIYGVIRGVGLSNDGRQSGFLAPDTGGQIRAMEEAYRVADVDPNSISLVECHATGTAVGDGIEIASMNSIFRNAKDLPIGSLKSNLGHLVTASGAASLIKLMSAMSAKTLPPTLHAEMPIDILTEGPMRPLATSERWESEGPRRAAINNFGFGGNNAHLILEEWLPTTNYFPNKKSPPVPPCEIAICGVGIAVNGCRTETEFTQKLFSQDATFANDRFADIEIPYNVLRFPPSDLKASLAQQTAFLEIGIQAVGQVHHLNPDRTGVFVGMGCDPEMARFGLRWRLSEFLDSDKDLTDPQNFIVRGINSESVLGCMPNIIANRLNAQFDWRGQGYSISSEELSGVTALQLAIRALRHNELDAALVGAVDLSREPVHEKAASELFTERRQKSGDAVVALVLKRREDAIKDGDRIVALVGDVSGGIGDGPGSQFSLLESETCITKRFGHAHAASGLLHVLAASCAYSIGENKGAENIAIRSFSGRARYVTLKGFDGSNSHIVGAPLEDDLPPEKSLRMPAHPPRIELSVSSKRAHQVNNGHLMPQPPALKPTAHLEPSLPLEPTPNAGQIRGVALETSVEVQDLTRTQMLARVADVHRSFIKNQNQLYQQFLGVQEKIMQSYAGDHVQISTREQPVLPSSLDAADVLKLPVEFPGLKISRAELETLAAGKISSVLGPLFEQQDDFSRQVRMPAGPLLLCDRVLGIEGEAGKMETGSIWTETDVTEDAWYLHQSGMTPGITIETGQADLLLVSWLGADFVNRGDRVYRLLGCEVSFHEGGLPKVGDTLRFDIHIDGHAKTGDVRLFFFHYDCYIGDRHLLSVREGRAGFFTDQELSDSGGVLWDAAEDQPLQSAQLDPAPNCTTKRSFTDADVKTFVSGDAYSCFGDGFEMAAPHQRTPTIPTGRLQLIDRVPVFDPTGGPWGRGYQKAETDVPVDSWFYEGHFLNDPCMPGTLMADAASQAMSFHMAALGFTINRDGWKFEPVTDVAFEFVCRGQVIPDRPHLLTYEVFIEEIIDGDTPTIFAAVLCSSDGFKVFQCRRFGMRLAVDWPLNSRQDLLTQTSPSFFDTPDGKLPGDYGVLLAAAWGRPSVAFGPKWAQYDGLQIIPRLPGPPYHFMTRIMHVNCAIAQPCENGTAIVEYDIPVDAWYFQENGEAVMPYSVLMEVLLQPCGWLASYMGFALTESPVISFRNLDGSNAVTKKEITPTTGVLKTETTLTRYSKVGDMTLVFFNVSCFAGSELVMSMETSFGFFDGGALASQVGLPITDQARESLSMDSDEVFDFSDNNSPLTKGYPKIASGSLLMLDQVTGYWPNAGEARLGRIRGRQFIRPEAWYFKAHFYQDPVQPGSLGIEALLQLLQSFVKLSSMHDGKSAWRFEAIALDEALIWKYRGQVVPTNKEVTTELEITRIEKTDDSILVCAKGSLWVDGLRIYEVENLATRLVPIEIVKQSDALVLNTDSEPWIKDHCPTYTVPALPMMSVVDYMACAVEIGSQKIISIENVRMYSWIGFYESQIKLKISEQEKSSTKRSVKLEITPDGFGDENKLAAKCIIEIGDAYRGAAPELSLLGATSVSTDVYGSGELFHGPAFHVVQSLHRNSIGASSIIDVGGGNLPDGKLNPALLDGMLHGIPHDTPEMWFGEKARGFAAYPSQIDRMEIYGDTPRQGLVRVEVRAEGWLGDGHQIKCHVQVITDTGVWIDMQLTEILMPKGPIGNLPPQDRRDFLKDKLYIPNARLSYEEDTSTVLEEKTVAATNWLPGTIEAVYEVSGPLSDITCQIAMKEHVAGRSGVHPDLVEIRGQFAIDPRCPLSLIPLQVEKKDHRFIVSDGGSKILDTSKIRKDWQNRLGVSGSPIEQIYFSIVEKFINQVTVADPLAFAKIYGQPCLFLGNHQVAIESLIFSIVASALHGGQILTLAKKEHQLSWLGRLARVCEAYPGIELPKSISYIDREDQSELLNLAGHLQHDLKQFNSSLMVHIEGTRSLHCRNPVVQISGVFIDLAIKAKIPIVPVRFSGGLPVSADSDATRLEFPVGYGHQDIHIGKPILPDELTSLPLVEQKSKILSNINNLGPEHSTELPNEPDLKISDAVHSLMDAKDMKEPQAVFLHAIENSENLSDDLKIISNHLRHGKSLPSNSEKQKWILQLAEWFKS